jgi:drug/metabolite transporter (DMT)-like permease
MLTWAWYFIVSKQARRVLGALEYQAALTICAAAAVTPVAIASRTPLRIPDGHNLLLMLVMVAVPGGGHLLMNWAHGHAPVTLTSLLTLAVPVVAAVGAAVFLAEGLTAGQVLGMVVAIGALALVLQRSSRRARLAAVPEPPV